MNRSFVRELVELRKGALQDEISQKYGELVQSVKETGKAGTITLTLKVSPLGKEGTMQQVTDEVKLTLPKTDRSPTIFFVTENGDHSLSDPSQPERNIKPVPDKGTTDLKTVAQPVGEVKEVVNG